MQVKKQLVDARNYDALEPVLLEKIENAEGLIGFDLETEDSNAHDGIKEIRASNPKKVIFDVNRTVVCGFSIYVDGDDTAYYFNLAHADVENRLDWLRVVKLLKAKPPGVHWVAHNAPFELVNCWKSLDFDLTSEIICTLQMLVSAYGPDEYPVDRFENAGLGSMAPIAVEAGKVFKSDDKEAQDELVGKIVAKESKAGHSYNGFVNSIRYGYGLKQAVNTWFGVDMQTFQATLGDAEHMGQLTGEQTAEYGADDAFWAVALYHRILKYMLDTNPAVVQTFFEQENPMVLVYARTWAMGLPVDEDGIRKGRAEERTRFAKALRELKTEVNALLPFDTAPNARLLELEKWYANYDRYRQKIATWAAEPDGSDFEVAMQCAGAVSNAWAAEVGYTKRAGPNFTHYMMMRTILYDLLGERPMRSEGKVQSDGENRGRLMNRLLKRIEEGEGVPHAKAGIRIIELLNRLASVEQAMKLYLTPYTKLVDPSTHRLYPVLSSKLASHRMASENPNGMQLAKRGQSVYVRGFFKAQRDDHVLVSIDWSQIELVLIGEFSGDPEFAKAYGQLPYDDLHKVAAAEILSGIAGTTITPEQFSSLRNMTDDVMEPFGFPLVDANGNHLTPKDAYKYNRGTAGGKGANFGYWYSGALASVALSRGIGSDLMWEMTDRYRSRFHVGEQWRIETINRLKTDGFLMLPDGHRRVRLEATDWWARHMQRRFRAYNNNAIGRFGYEVCKRIQTRSGNQGVNSMIQGTCATLAKRSILRMDKRIASEGFDAVFVMPIHDELVWSVRRDQAVEFIKQAKQVMKSHSDIVSKLVIDCSASVGMTLEPFHPTSAPYGQIELDEAPKIPGVVPDEKINGVLNPSEIEKTLEYLTGTHRELAGA